jgi:hypothetical protein
MRARRKCRPNNHSHIPLEQVEWQAPGMATIEEIVVGYPEYWCLPSLPVFLSSGRTRQSAIWYL